MIAPISVSTLNEQIKSLLEATFLNVSVEGEVSRPTYHSSGHLYFTLKDENSSISCVMFKGNNQKLKFRIEEGMRLVIWGAVSLYVPRGAYQINCVGAEPSGSGALALAYEQLKKELLSLGYFEQSLKKSLPKFPTRIALVTSSTGAVLQDMLHVAQKRWPLIEIVLFDTLVQGDGARFQIAKAIHKADEGGFDTIVVARGGGSIEDLWAFNEKEVADAIFQAKTPIISAIGHEIDYVISDFVADVRAPTPSAAMEILLPDINEMRLTLDNITLHVSQRFTSILNQKAQLLNHYLQSIKLHSLDVRFANVNKEISTCKELLDSKFLQILQKSVYEVEGFKSAFESAKIRNIQTNEAKLNSLKQIFVAKEPKNEVKFGYAQVVKSGKVTSAESLKVGEEFEIQTPQVVVKSQVKELVRL